MLNNDVIRSIRYILDVNDKKMIEIFGLAGVTITLEEVRQILKPEDAPDFLFCEDKPTALFLDGVIYYKRGKDESRPVPPLELPVTNNLVLKKLRVAFTLKEDDMLTILESANCKLGRPELSALMRKKDHPKYRECGDQILRYFLKGLTLKVAPAKTETISNKE